MALSFRRLAATFVSRLMLGNSYPTLSRVVSVACRPLSCFISLLCCVRLEGGFGTNNNEFQRWHNGGGTFHKSAQIDPTAVLDVGAVVHSKAVVGANSYWFRSCYWPSVTIGQSTKIWFNVALSNCTIGDLCVIHNGVCIGQDGFGFMVDELGTMTKKPQFYVFLNGYKSHDHGLAHTEIFSPVQRNDVEIGADTCIDRGSWRDTIIGDHTKIDNLVQIGHNVVIGNNCMLCGYAGIAGSATIGDYVTMGARVIVRDHVLIISKVGLAATTCVTKDIKTSGDYGGFPAVPIHEWRRQVAMLSRTSKKRNF